MARRRSSAWRRPRRIVNTSPVWQRLPPSWPRPDDGTCQTQTPAGPGAAATAIDEQAHGTNHHEVALDLFNLALLLSATNRLAEAEATFERALAIQEATLGPEHQPVGHTLSNLALLLQRTGRAHLAEAMMRRALARSTSASTVSRTRRSPLA